MRRLSSVRPLALYYDDETSLSLPAYVVGVVVWSLKLQLRVILRGADSTIIVMHERPPSLCNLERCCGAASSTAGGERRE